MFYFQGMHVILVALQCSSLKSVCSFVCFFVYLWLCSVFLSVGISRVIVYVCCNVYMYVILYPASPFWQHVPRDRGTTVIGRRIQRYIGQPMSSTTLS